VVGGFIWITMALIYLGCWLAVVAAVAAAAAFGGAYLLLVLGLMWCWWR